MRCAKEEGDAEEGEWEFRREWERLEEPGSELVWGVVKEAVVAGELASSSLAPPYLCTLERGCNETSVRDGERLTRLVCPCGGACG